jgi:hypothetical protein
MQQKNLLVTFRMLITVDNVNRNKTVSKKQIKITKVAGL